MIADRAKLMEEIDILKKLKFSNGVNGLSKEGDLLSEIIKVNRELCLCVWGRGACHTFNYKVFAVCADTADTINTRM